MTISFGSGQTSGLPLVVTAITQGTAQTLHTAPTGSATPNRIRINALNLDPKNPHTLFVGVFASGSSTPTALYKIALPINEGQLSALDPNLTSALPELVLNGAAFIAVWADTASQIAVSARVDNQNGVAAFNFGSGQTNGLPLIPTTQIAAPGVLPTSNTGLLLHTAPSGVNTPSLLRLYAQNLDTANQHTLTVGIFASGATTPTVTYQIAVPANDGVLPATDPLNLTEFILNGSSFVQIWADVASMIAVYANVQTQAGGTGTATIAQALMSGLVAAVQNANRFAMNAQGGTGQATEANAQVMSPGAGTVANLSAVASAAIGVGASVTAALRQNGVTTTQSVTLTNASGTTLVTTTGAPVVIAKGDLLDFIIAETNNVAPAANIQVTAELVLNS